MLFRSPLALERLPTLQTSTGLGLGDLPGFGLLLIVDVSHASAEPLVEENQIFSGGLSVAARHELELNLLTLVEGGESGLLHR